MIMDAMNALNFFPRVTMPLARYLKGLNSARYSGGIVDSSI